MTDREQDIRSNTIIEVDAQALRIRIRWSVRWVLVGGSLLAAAGTMCWLGS
ncbi:MAG: hypothetical protein KDK70_00770 [Myxococcales bacterium]|nr:hypothetical protein [Myxococcales bacterium]